jgi:RNA polymerase sigma factor (sigma-70 family)
MASTTTLETPGAARALGPSDAELLDRVRAGDDDAYGLLWERHEPSARSLARYLTKSGHDADDVVADAFARVLRAIKGGAGPTESFRPYLLTAVRRTVWRKAEDANHHRLAADEDEEEMLDLRLAVEPEDRTEEALILRAFGELPERWQLVLWHTEIEGQPPAEVAPLLGLSPNATAALAVRAREGLRQAYLQAHLQARPADACQFTVEHLGAYVRDGLGKRDTARLEEHLDGCEDCTNLRSDLGSLNKVLRAVVGPAVLGTGAARYLAERAEAATDGATSIVRRIRFPEAVGLAGVAALVMAALAVQSDVARPDPPTSATAAAEGLEPVDADHLVDVALVGTAANPARVTTEPCGGVALPLSLPRGATPTGAALVQTDAGAPEVVAPTEGEQLAPVPSEGGTLVGSDGACVSDVLNDLGEAPPDTALAVSFLDRLGQLQILIVPEIVATVQEALQTVTDGAIALTAAVSDYLEQLADIADQTAAGGGTGDSASLPGDITVPGAPDGADLPTLPGVPSVPVPDDPVGGVVGGVGDIVDDVAGGAGDVLDDLIG